MLNCITWEHPRAYKGLELVTHKFERDSGVSVRWHRRSLGQFESQPIDEVAKEFDILILDHPFVGDVQKSGCLHDLDQIMPDLAKTEMNCVGASLASYRLGGLWAAPVDAACQVAAYRPDLLALHDDILIPGSYEMLAEFTRTTKSKIALAWKCPHAFMNYLSICGSLGADISGEDPSQLIAQETSLAALDILKTLSDMSVAEALDWSSIDCLDAMVFRHDIIFCPLVFGFAPYGLASASTPSLRFCNMPSFGSRLDSVGAVIGGAGVAISKTCRNIEGAKSLVRYLMRDDVQLRMGLAGGQPALTSVWQSNAINLMAGIFYRDTLATMKNALVRPRYAGYGQMQVEAGHLLRKFVQSPHARALQTAQRLDELHRHHRQSG